MVYVAGAVERAMKVQEVILRALSGQLTWLQAADILDRSPRSIRRLRLRYERYGYDGLFDRRRRDDGPARGAHDLGTADGPLHRPCPLGRAYARRRWGGRSHQAHASRPGLGPPRHRTYPRLLAPGPRPQRADERHVAGPPR